MRPFTETIPLAEAFRRINGIRTTVERVERIPIELASGRVVAHTVRATGHVPPFDRAAMDGYAVAAGDTTDATRETPRVLTCVERVFTGEVPQRRVGRGECIEIATGAPLPEGADAVVMVEETGQAPDGRVNIFSPVRPRQHVGARGADLREDQVFLDPGTVLNPARVGALAANGMVDVEVYARPRVAILSTGNEIVDPGRPLGPGQIYDVNRFTVAALVCEHGGEPVPRRAAPDTIDDLSRALDACLADDIVVFSGGSSVGDRDLIVDVLRARGEVLFHGIAVKPGKPTVCGLIGTTPVLGMPGYPTSCLSNAYILLVPLLRRLAHLPPYEPRTIALPLAQRIVSATGRHQFYTVRIAGGEAVPAFKASGDITSMSQADGYIEVPARTEVVEKGEVVEVRLF